MCKLCAGHQQLPGADYRGRMIIKKLSSVAQNTEVVFTLQELKDLHLALEWLLEDSSNEGNGKVVAGLVQHVTTACANSGMKYHTENEVFTTLHSIMLTLRPLAELIGGHAKQQSEHITTGSPAVVQ